MKITLKNAICCLTFFVGINTCLYSMENLKESNHSLYINGSFVLRTSEEIDRYLSELSNLIKDKKYIEVIRIGSLQPCLDLKTDVCHESFEFYRIYSGILSSAYCQLGEQKILSGKKDLAIKCYLNSINSSNIFVLRYGMRTPIFINDLSLFAQKAVISEYNIMLLTYHKWVDCHERKYTYESKLEIIRLKQCIINIFADMLAYSEIVPNLVDTPVKYEYLISLMDTYVTLFQCCLDLPILYGKDKIEGLQNKAIEIRDFFHIQTDALAKKYFVEAQNGLELMNKCLEINNIKNYKLSKKVIDIKINKADLERQKIVNNQNKNLLIDSLDTQTIDKINYTTQPLYSLSKNNDSLTIVSAKHEYMCSLVRNNYKDDSLKELIVIEDNIRIIICESNPFYTLYDIYQLYHTIVGDTFFNSFINCMLPVLLNVGKMDEAVERINILSQLEYNKTQEVSLYTRYVRAAILSMTGDRTEWEIIEQELASIKEAKREAKRIAKQKEEAQTAALIREFQQSQAVVIKSEASKKNASPQIGRNAPLQKIEDIQTEEAYVPEISQSLQDHKRNKIDRHEEALKQRATKKEEKPLKTQPEKVLSSKKANILDEHLPFDIQDLYELHGSAKDVNTEIVNGTWKFSRDQAEAYFQVLGCDPKHGGKHEKVTLPRALIIQHNGVTLTILNDLGGSLTLPRWDGVEGNGEVPHYLRAQILEARKKLVLLQMKAREQTK